MAAFVKTKSVPAMAATAAAAAAEASSMNSYVAVVLDITASMTNQIQGVKNAVRELIPLLAENPGLGIVIITFTEGGGSFKKGQLGCYVSVDVFSDPTAADNFVRSITLAKPPGHPNVNAYGDDGEENAKAALHALTELDGSKPTVAFFITDAGYHRNKRDSDTAQAEEDYLVQKGVTDTDFYVMFDAVLAHFGGSLVVVPIVYNFETSAAHVIQAYGQMGLTSGSGVVIQPVDNSPMTLALTMGTFVTRLLGQLNNQTDLTPAPPQEMLTGLRVFNASAMMRQVTEASTAGPRPRAGDAGELFDSAMTRAATTFKVSWNRCIDVNKVSLLRQLVFGLTAAKFVHAVTSGSPLSETLMTRLEESYPVMLEGLPEDQRGQIKATPEVIETLAMELAAAGTVGAGEGREEAADSVSLETVRDKLEAALKEETRVVGEEEEEKLIRMAFSKVDPLEMVFAMVHGVLVNVRFPPGPTGNPNFADAWSAMIDKHSFDVVSAESAVRLFKDKGGGVGAYWSPTEEKEKESVALGLTDRREYNGFVPLMDEGDPLKTTVMRIFSGLQVMNLLQMTVLSGSPGGFLPNMYPGVLAATLARVIRTSAGGSWSGVEGASCEANDRLASQMVFSLRGIMGAPARSTRLRLAAGKADPSNALSKFLMVLCKAPRGTEKNEEVFTMKMRLVLNEWVAATVQLYFGKSTPENDEKFYAFVQDIIPLEAVFGDEALDVDPLERLHPLEVAEGKEASDIEGNSAALDGWESVGLANLCKTTLYKDLRRLVDRCRVVFGCLDMEYDIDDLVLDYIVYRFRNARYDFIEPAASPASERKNAGNVSRKDRGTHEPIEDMPSTLGLLMKIYKKSLQRKLAGMKEARRVHAIDVLKTRVVKARSMSAENRSTQLLGTTYSLDRTHVPDILEAAGYSDLAFVEKLILGKWTPEPPQCLRRFSVDIILNVDAAGGGGEAGLSERLRDAISQQEVCMRTWRANRHGHTASLRYPGPMGWTEAYEAARNANLAETEREPARILPQMKHYTECGAEVLRRLEDGNVKYVRVVPEGVCGSEERGASVAQDAKTAVRGVLYSYNDANLLPCAWEKIEAFGVLCLLEGL